MLRVTRDNSHVNYRYTVAPSELPYLNAIPKISVTREEVIAEIEIGYRDGIRAIEAAKNKQKTEL